MKRAQRTHKTHRLAKSIFMGISLRRRFPMQMRLGRPKCAAAVNARNAFAYMSDKRWINS